MERKFHAKAETAVQAVQQEVHATIRQSEANISAQRFNLLEELGEQRSVYEQALERAERMALYRPSKAEFDGYSQCEAERAHLSPFRDAMSREAATLSTPFSASSPMHDNWSLASLPESEPATASSSLQICSGSDLCRLGPGHVRYSKAKALSAQSMLSEPDIRSLQ